ncbi:MAG: cell division protein FtsL [Lachnospiraceae bacterium]|nr:cell division protein FtsL [Lachnospiraceae bacterium]
MNNTRRNGNVNRSGRSGQGAKRKTGAVQTGYIHGTALVKPAADPRRENAPRRERQAGRNFRTIPGGKQAERPSKRSSILSLLFMVGALVITAFALYRYVDVQTSLEGSATTIAELEKELATLRQENDEAYSRANATIDLEEVKRVAIQELGMKYADEGQIIVYSDDGAADYVRQLAAIPDAAKK